ncbi:sensor histidine kinase [Anaerobacillus alkalidiazotrophicus]|uniref:sensor histidine kinase n=1 Tax=Anaerobacillus alkalidiazotrophicus TaxID=472963 RepID=UPI0009FD5D88|nr:HAMP domain-containing sensor histidine kinase [Anaerobacillus alkalidiazotrophicus]
MNEIEPLLLNVLFLLCFLLFVPFFVERLSNELAPVKKRRIFLFSACVGGISCLLFPINIYEGFQFDLRWIILIFVGLYSGTLGNILIFVAMTMYHFFLGGDGFYTAMFIGMTILISVYLVRHTYQVLSMKKKLLLSGSLSLFSSIFVLFILSVYQVTVSSPFVINYLSFMICTTLLVVYLYELILEKTIIDNKLVKAEKMEIVSYLASSISHEVRNPLAVVRGFLQMMDQVDLSSDKRKEYLKISIAEVDRANDIIRNYLTFAKPIPESFDVMNIKDELLRAINIIMPLANMNSIEVEHKIGTFFIKGDPQLLQQILLNITKNCIEAMEGNGKLIIQTTEESGRLTIEITDNGQGMTEEQLSRLGEPYFTTKGGEGTGLGMMVTFRIVEIMKGKLTVTSKVNEGTTFYISFPLVNSIEVPFEKIS